MEAHKLRILVGNAFNALKAAYEADHKPLHFDVVVQAHLHCRYVCGIDSRYGDLIETLEQLEDKLETVAGRPCLPKWRARWKFMHDLTDAGQIQEPANIERAAQFMKFIDMKLEENSTNRGAGQGDAPRVDEQMLFLSQLLHPLIIEHSWPQFQYGQLRDAVLNAFIAIGDLIRSKTGLKQDGKPLTEQALSMRDPYLILSTLETQSGRDDQLGFMQIISGAFQGVRNPKAHSLNHDLNPIKAAQYLVFASLLARRISEAMECERNET